jgi:hypothetical protein
MQTLPSWMLDDSSDLRWAVETVAAMWARGDGRKTLLWLRQASETARGDGLDGRAEALAQAAAEFERLGLSATLPTGEGTTPGVNAPASATASPVPAVPASAPAAPSSGPPAPPSAPPVPSSAPQSPASPNPAARRRLPPTAPYNVVDAPTHLEAPASDLIEAIRRVDDTDPDHPAQPESAPRPSRPLPPEVRREPLEPTVVMEEESSALLAAQAQKQHAEERASNSHSTLESPRPPLEPMRAVRVAVRPGSGKELSVLLLDDGEKAPQGSQEALLLAVGDNFRG